MDESGQYETLIYSTNLELLCLVMTFDAFEHSERFKHSERLKYFERFECNLAPSCPHLCDK